MGCVSFGFFFILFCLRHSSDCRYGIGCQSYFLFRYCCCFIWPSRIISSSCYIAHLFIASVFMWCVCVCVNIWCCMHPHTYISFTILSFADYGLAYVRPQKPEVQTYSQKLAKLPIMRMSCFLLSYLWVWLVESICWIYRRSDSTDS